MTLRFAVSALLAVVLPACPEGARDEASGASGEAFLGRVEAALDAPEPEGAFLDLVFTEGMTDWELDLARSTARRLGGQEGVTRVELAALPEGYDGVSLRDGARYAPRPSPVGMLVFTREDGTANRMPYGREGDGLWIVGTRRTVADRDAPSDVALQIGVIGMAQPTARFEGWCDIRLGDGRVERVPLDDQGIGNQTRALRGQGIEACRVVNTGGRGSVSLRLHVGGETIYEGRVEAPDSTLEYPER